MIKRAITLAAATALAVGAMAGTASAHEVPDLSEPHPHALVLGVEVEMTEEGPVLSFRKCVDLAAGRTLRTNNHHENLHKPGEFHGTKQAGHVVAPYTCAQLAQMFG